MTTTTSVFLLQVLPDHLLSALLSEWSDAADVAKIMRHADILSIADQRRFAAQPAFVLRARRVMSKREIAWLRSKGFRLQLFAEKKIIPNHSTRWLLNGVPHREDDQPAVIWDDGTQEYWRHGKLHRDGDLPAVIRTEGITRGMCDYYRDGRRHRDGGKPAVEGPLYRAWYRDGKRHREDDLPAFVCSDGHLHWYQHGRRHREGDLPAIVYANGIHEYYKNGVLHRENGLPARDFEHNNGRRVWYLNGVAYQMQNPGKPPYLVGQRKKK